MLTGIQIKVWYKTIKVVGTDTENIEKQKAAQKEIENRKRLTKEGHPRTERAKERREELHKEERKKKMLKESNEAWLVDFVETTKSITG